MWINKTIRFKVNKKEKTIIIKDVKIELNEASRPYHGLELPAWYADVVVLYVLFTHRQLSRTTLCPALLDLLDFLDATRLLTSQHYQHTANQHHHTATGTTCTTAERDFQNI